MKFITQAYHQQRLGIRSMLIALTILFAGFLSISWSRTVQAAPLAQALPDPTLFAHWEFEDNLVTDSSRNSYDLTIGSNDTTTTTIQRYGQASLEVNAGTNTKLPNATPDIFLPDEFSISSWVYLDPGGGPSPADPVMIIANTGNPATPQNGFKIVIEDPYNTDAAVTQNILVQIGKFNATSTDIRGINTTTGLNVGGWQHIVMTLERFPTQTAVELYHNGILVGSNPSANSLANPFFQIDDFLRFGNSGGPNATFPGFIDDVRIYSGTLTAGHVTGLYQGLPDIDVLGAGASILDGDTAPAIADDTDFDNVVINTPDVHTFTINGSSLYPLFLSSPLTITDISGSSAFTISAPSITTIPASASASFQITFTPPTSGLFTATVEIGSSSLCTPTYEFVVQGTGTEPEIRLLGNSTVITDGNTAFSTADDTEFGNVIIGSPISHIFTIKSTSPQIQSRRPAVRRHLKSSLAQTRQVHSPLPLRSATTTSTRTPIALMSGVQVLRQR